MTLPRYVLIAGHGRSGTNWLLDLLDLSPRTHCRNEPNEILGTALSVLPGAIFANTEDDAIATSWDDSIEQAAAKIGERDHRPLSPKRHVWPISQILRLDALMYRPRLRSAIRWARVFTKDGEWHMPLWIGDQRLLTEALTVFKLVQTPGWVTWVLKNRPDVLVLHIVRHPGGFLNSWRRRYVAYKGIDTVTRDNKNRINSLVRLDNKWKNRIIEVDAMSVDETELWYWKYSTETIHQTGLNKNNYHLIVYEDLVKYSQKKAEEIYKKCGLNWNDKINYEAHYSSDKSSNIASAWRKKLDKNQIFLVEKFAQESILYNAW